jgi:hypothetical protein
VHCIPTLCAVQWTTLCIALAQAVLLRHRLPLAFWPCAAVMLGGAAMVIVPSVGQVRLPTLLCCMCYCDVPGVLEYQQNGAPECHDMVMCARRVPRVQLAMWQPVAVPCCTVLTLFLALDPIGWTLGA